MISLQERGLALGPVLSFRLSPKEWEGRLGNWRRSTLDPTTDPIAGEVIAAFEVAQRAQLSTRACYQAAVDAWRDAYPDQAPHYASSRAIEVILRAKASLRVEV
jgi:hypothetical protein